MSADAARPRLQPVEVELRGIRKSFGATPAVHSLWLEVGRGEFFTLLGPSGCGKTTTLRMIAGLLQPDAGEILFDGRPVTRTPPWHRNIGMVFQNYALWPHMTVFENVAFGLVERHVDRGAIPDLVNEALALVGLEGLGGRRPSQLSGGQQQRVALARAIVVRPALLLLDEPLSNLDARLRIQMRNELVKLQRHLGITTIYVTHDQEEALMLSTRIAVMHGGHLVQLGTPQEVYERPADVFVADFLGGANFLRGVVHRVGGDAVLVDLWGGRPDGRTLLQAAPERNAGFAPGDRVIVCLRPEALEPVPPQALPDLSGNVLVGTLKLVNYLGATMVCEVEVLDGQTVRVQTAHPRARRHGREGGPIAIRVAADDVLLLRPPDATTQPPARSDGLTG
ncbi:MAG: ABC transporter ATP-binding protein [Armatimonadota bacterium]|nr:ABC transporter ATP-binding protein [Armatimonadota bacterium]